MSRPVKKRSYVSAVRQQGANETRARVLGAARDLFLERGYAQTTTSGVARAAGVSQASIFAAFGSKAQLLVAVVSAEASGSVVEPMRQRPQWRRIAGEPDPATAIALFARFATQAHGRTWRLLSLVRAASDGDPDLAAAAARAAEARRSDCEWLVRDVLRIPEPGPGDGPHDGHGSDHVVDVLWAQSSVDVYRLLVVDRRWSPERYEHWLTETLRTLLLA